MRVALASPVSISHYAGCEKWVVGVANALASMGHKVDVYATPYTPKRNADPRSVLRGDVGYFEGWALELSDDYDVVYVVYTPVVWRVFRSSSPKVAGMHYYLCVPTELEEAVLRNVPVALRYYDPISVLTYWAFRAFGQRDLRRFDAVHVPNNPYRLPLRHWRVLFVPNWVDLGLYRPTREKADEFTVLFVGRHCWDKGWLDYCAICRGLRRAGLPIRCLSTGEGSWPVEGLGFVSDEELVDAYSSSHALVYPSRSDTFGLVILEALACNTPVVTTSIEPHRALGLPLIYADSPREFVREVVRLYRMWEEGTYWELVEGLRDSVTRYDVRRVMPMIEDMLESVADC